jgi:hypothetical protein
MATANSVIDYSKIPQRTMDSIEAWIGHGLVPGSFLQAVLSNHLAESFARADEENRAALYEIVAWLVNCAPHGCFGSSLAVANWANRKRAERARAERNAQVAEPFRSAVNGFSGGDAV